MRKYAEEQHGEDITKGGGNSKLIDDILMITYNGVTFESRAGVVNINSSICGEIT